MSWDKEDVLEKIYWMKQVLAICVGLTYGLSGVEGLVYALSFLAIALLASVMYMRSVLKVEDEEPSEFSELLSEGLGPGFTLFMLTWLATYNAMPYALSATSKLA